MRDAARELAHGLQALGLRQAPLELRARRASERSRSVTSVAMEQTA